MKTIQLNLKTAFRYGLMILSVCGMTSMAQASDDGTGWNYFASAYLTSTSIDAKSTAPSPKGDMTVDIDASFSDLLENLDYGLSGLFIARKGKVSINLDLFFVGLSFDEKSVSVNLPPSVTPTLKAKIEMDLREHEFYLGYAAFDSYPDIEVISGIRYIDQDISVKLTTDSGQQKFNIGDNWFDPFVGLRYYGPIANKWNLYLRGDIGGFGVGSDFVWRADAGITYRFDRNWEAAFFYKALDIDYKTGTSGTSSIYKWDGTESGLTLGIGYYFD